MLMMGVSTMIMPLPVFCSASLMASTMTGVIPKGPMIVSTPYFR